MHRATTYSFGRGISTWTMPDESVMSARHARTQPRKGVQRNGTGPEAKRSKAKVMKRMSGSTSKLCVDLVPLEGDCLHSLTARPWPDGNTPAPRLRLRMVQSGKMRRFKVNRREAKRGRSSASTLCLVVDRQGSLHPHFSAGPVLPATVSHRLWQFGQVTQIIPP
jgi:hypothetical protein